MEEGANLFNWGLNHYGSGEHTQEAMFGGIQSGGFVCFGSQQAK